MSNTLKVIAVNGSPLMGISNTNTMIQMIKSVLSNEGIDLEEIFLAEKRIEYCIGCGVCTRNEKCWREDDHAGIIDKLFTADGIILASPVFFWNVTAQMKAFIDRCLTFAHNPRATWKPGMAISVSGGKGENTVAQYLASILRAFGAFSIGTLTAISPSLGTFMGKDLVEARAKDLTMDLARAIKEKRQYPATEDDLSFYLFMGDLVNREKDSLTKAYKHWQESGLFKGFDTYIKQHFAKSSSDPKLIKEWIRDRISKEKARIKGSTPNKTTP